MQKTSTILIIGAGIAGLTAAKLLKQAGKKVLVVDAADKVGGRVSTDEVDGFLLDRGFQVLLTAYPETRQLLDYSKLDLKKFSPGATILNKQNKYDIGDPMREPLMLFKTLFSPVGNLSDKFKLLSLKIKLASASIESIFKKEETTTLNYLQQYGFSERFIRQFFKPFFAGIYLEDELQTSSRMFEYLFKMFGEGYAAVPAKGMGMISAQLAETLSEGELILNEKIIKIEDSLAYGESGKVYEANQIVIATDAANIPSPYGKQKVEAKHALTLYFTADATMPTTRIALNATDSAWVNNVAFMDHISPYYAPKGKALIAVSLKAAVNANDPNLVQKTVAELVKWYPKATNWQHLKTYAIPYALPIDQTVTNEPTLLKLNDNCYICGDHLLNGSINAAMKSGRLVAESILQKG